MNNQIIDPSLCSICKRDNEGIDTHACVTCKKVYCRYCLNSNELGKENRFDFATLLLYDKCPECLQQRLEENIEKDYLWETIGSLTDMHQVAKRFLEAQPIYYDEAKLWWLWNTKQKCWIVCDEVDIINAFNKHILYPPSKIGIKNELIEAVKQEARKNKPKSMKKTWVQFQDIVADIETGDRFEATPQYLFTNPIPHNFGKSERTPIIDRIFEEWVGEKYKKTLYEIMAYCMIPDYPIHRVFCFIGPGSNGKSSFLRLLDKFLGKNNVSTTDLDILLSSRFELSCLHNKLVCIMGETNFVEMKRTNLLKQISGQDSIRIEYKNKMPFKYTNYAKIIIATNNLPGTNDKTIGFYRRWLLIDFSREFTEAKEILDEIPEVEYENLTCKLGIILMDILKNRKFTNEGSIEERQQRYEEKSNPFDKFWKEMVVESPESHIFKFEFKDRFYEWCEKNKVRKFSERMIANIMKEKGIIEERRTAYHEEVDGKGIEKRYRAWVGIEWKDVNVQDVQLVHDDIT